MSDDSRLRAWVERLSVVAIVGSVAALAVPKYASMQREQVAAQILADVEVLRTAVYAFYSDSAYFPPSSAGQPAPESLIPYLPASFSFARPYGRLEYRNWEIAPSRPMPGTRDSSVARADSSGTSGATAGTAALGATMGVGGLPATNVVGVTVTVQDGRVGAMAASKTAPRAARFVVGNKYTFLFFGT